jgi:hypothetical protein
MQRYTIYFIWKLLSIFWVVQSPNIRSAYNCICSIWYLSHRYCYLPLSWKSWNWFLCAQHTDDGWRYHSKHVEQFPNKINCVTLHLVRYILEYKKFLFVIAISFSYNLISSEDFSKKYAATRELLPYLQDHVK